MIREGTIGFIGGGNMAEALIKGLLTSRLYEPDRILVYEPDTERAEFLAKEYGVRMTSGNAELADEAAVIMLAVKPQIMNEALEDIRDRVTPQHLVISVAAGVRLTYYEEAFGLKVPVVRAMPNNPALVLAGATALSAGRQVTPEHMKLARSIFGSVGRVEIVNEKHMDVVTGLSGSGPAYVYVLIEALADGAVRMGMHRKQALTLAAQTVFGAAKLVLDSGRHPGELKDMVTSPGGTAIAGLHALERGAFRVVIQEAVAAATERSRQLGD